jgi:hypothetical protein
LCHAYQGDPPLALREKTQFGRVRWQWVIDPVWLGYLTSHRINLDEAAARFNVEQTMLAHAKDGGELGRLLATLPLPPKIDRRHFNSPFNLPHLRKRRAEMTAALKVDHAAA